MGEKAKLLSELAAALVDVRNTTVRDGLRRRLHELGRIPAERRGEDWETDVTYLQRDIFTAAGKGPQ